jgi:hypothetical protein
MGVLPQAAATIGQKITLAHNARLNLDLPKSAVEAVRR